MGLKEAKFQIFNTVKNCIESNKRNKISLIKKRRLNKKHEINQDKMIKLKQINLQPNIQNTSSIQDVHFKTIKTEVFFNFKRNYIKQLDSDINIIHDSVVRNTETPADTKNISPCPGVVNMNSNDILTPSTMLNFNLSSPYLKNDSLSSANETDVLKTTFEDDYTSSKLSFYSSKPQKIKKKFLNQKINRTYCNQKDFYLNRIHSIFLQRPTLYIYKRILI